MTCEVKRVNDITMMIKFARFIFRKMAQRLYMLRKSAVFTIVVIISVCYLLNVLHHGGDQSKPKIENFSMYEDSDKPGRDVDLRIIILTYSRPKSLERLLNSINRAFYDTDKVQLEIWIDKSKANTFDMETLQLANTFKFQKGNCSVQMQPVHAGIKGQWLKTWKSFSTDEIAVILEDDLTVSPHFYRYLKLVHTKYRDRPDVAGFSLQGSSMRHSDGGCCLEIPFENKVFLYPTLGTSGFSPNNKNWQNFKTWYKDVMDKNIKVPLPENHITSEWFKIFSKNGLGDTIWEMEYLYYTQKNKEYTLYPNFPGHLGLTFNWMESGLHYSRSENRTEKDEAKNLLYEWNIKLEDLPDQPVYVDNSGKLIH